MTDVSDAEWIADLLRHGRVRGSAVPSAAQRQLRDLTRSRSTLVGERRRVVNSLQKVLDYANLKLAGVVSDIMGKSAWAVLNALLAVGETEPDRLAALAEDRLRTKRDQLRRPPSTGLARTRPRDEGERLAGSGGVNSSERCGRSAL